METHRIEYTTGDNADRKAWGDVFASQEAAEDEACRLVGKLFEEGHPTAEIVCLPNGMIVHLRRNAQ